MKRFLAIAVSAGILAGAAMPATAQVTLKASTPAPESSTANLAQVDLQFDGPIDPASLTIDLVMTAMPGMRDHAPMRIAGFKTTVAPDARSATLTTPRTLPPGTYRLKWAGRSVDGKGGTGTLQFSTR